MPLASVHACALAGVAAPPVTVEVHLGGGLPGMAIVGLPQSAVRESKDRVRAAIAHAGLRFPQVKVVVNLAPADLPKHGGRFDLPIALGVLIASGQLAASAVVNLRVLGELGLGGELRAVAGALPAAQASRAAGERLLLPAVDFPEAMLCPGARVCGVATLAEAVATLGSGSDAAFVLGDGGGLGRRGGGRHVGSPLSRRGEGGSIVDESGRASADGGSGEGAGARAGASGEGAGGDGAGARAGESVEARTGRSIAGERLGRAGSTNDDAAPRAEGGTAVARGGDGGARRDRAGSGEGGWAGEGPEDLPDLADVIGQLPARRALEVAAAGAHNVLFCGPPGTGKSMLASRLPGILPPMDERAASEAAAVASVSQSGFDVERWGVRPYRSPHHTVSAVALVGGGCGFSD